MKLLKSLYEVESPSGKEDRMVDYIESLLKSYGAETYRDSINNLYAIKGESDSYPCIVAHTDEVHMNKPKGYDVFLVGEDMLVGIDTIEHGYVGIGADDKNGIWVALKLFKQQEVVKGAFFVSEEVGCVGSSHADMTFFEDCRFVLQCDRRGSSDFITNAAGVELSTPEFLNDIKIESFGFQEANGSITDVMQLKNNGLGVCAANISCGYYNPHMDTEFTIFSELVNTLRLVEHIFNTLTEVYPHEYKSYYSKNSYSYTDDWHFADEEFLKEEREYFEMSLVELFEKYDLGELSHKETSDSLVVLWNEVYLKETEKKKIYERVAGIRTLQ